jgi:hypothetical protein
MIPFRALQDLASTELCIPQCDASNVCNLTAKVNLFAGELGEFRLLRRLLLVLVRREVLVNETMELFVIHVAPFLTF